MGKGQPLSNIYIYYQVKSSAITLESEGKAAYWHW